MAKPGPRPRSTAPKSIHIAFTDEERRILNYMGSGDVKSKIRTLIFIEAERQKPSSKPELKARWLLAKAEAKQKVSACNVLKEMMKELGITDEEIEQLEEGEEDSENR
jgi:hypothetical protein